MGVPLSFESEYASPYTPCIGSFAPRFKIESNFFSITSLFGPCAYTIPQKL